MPIDQIQTRHTLAILRPIWRPKPTVARRVRERLGHVFQRAVALGYCEGNPAREVTAVLSNIAKPVQHRMALAHDEVGAVLAKVRDSNEWIGNRLAFELLVLTACRSGEVRAARWEAVDTEARVWTITGERSKTGKAHRLPLSTQAVDLLERPRTGFGLAGLAFPSAHGHPMNARALPEVLCDLKIGAVPHGFRSSFRDWAGENN